MKIVLAFICVVTSHVQYIIIIAEFCTKRNMYREKTLEILVFLCYNVSIIKKMNKGAIK